MSKAYHIKPTQHTFIAGRTGSGKTVLVRNYLAGYDNVICLDTKGTTIWPEVDQAELTLARSWNELMRAKTPKVIYRPAWEEMNPETYHEFFKWIYLRMNTIVWVDEAMSVTPNPSVIPEYYKAILTRGRERETAVWSLTQRPTGIHQIIISESSHIFSFDLNMPQDREKIAKVTGAPEFLEKPGKFMFWHYYVENEHATLATLKLNKK